MIGTLRAGWSAGRITPRTRERINAAIGTILEAGTQSGAFRSDVEADDVTSMLLGVFLSTAQSGPTDQTWRLLDLLVDAVRPGTPRDIAPAAPAARRRPPGTPPVRR